MASTLDLIHPLGAYRWPRGTRRVLPGGVRLVAMTRWHLIDTEAQREERRVRFDVDGIIEFEQPDRRGLDGTPMRCGLRTPRTREWLDVQTRVLRTVEQLVALEPALCRGCLSFLSRDAPLKVAS